MKATISIVIFWSLSIATVVGLTAHASSPRKPKTIKYDRAVNETLDTIMWVHDQLSQVHQQITWDQLNAEVCRHMNVKRTQPWERRH